MALEAPPMKTEHTVGNLQVTERDLDMFQHIFDCGPLSTSAIHEYINPKIDKQNTYRRLNSWSQAPFRFVFKPDQQRMRENANYKDDIYNLTNDGMMLLIAYGRLDERHIEWRKKIHRGSFWHSYMTAMRLASIKLGIKKAGMQYVSKFEYFERMNIKPNFNPLSVDGTGYKTDDLYGIDIGDYIHTFIHEDDLKNEPSERITSVGSDFIEKVEKIEEHREAIMRHFSVSRFKMLVTTVSEGHRQDIMRKMKRFPESVREHIGLQTESSYSPLAERETIPCPKHRGEKCWTCRSRGVITKRFDDRCFTRPYLRVGFSPFNIGEPYGTEDRTPERVVQAA